MFRASLAAVAVLASPGVSVSLRGEACPGPDLTTRVAAQLTRPVASDARVRAEGVLAREADRWRLDLELETPHGPSRTRVFRAERCGDAMDAAAFVVALALDPALAAAEPANPPNPAQPAGATQPAASPDHGTEAVAPAAATVEPAAAETPLPVSRKRRKVRGMIRGAIGVAGAALPGVTAAFEGAVGPLGRRWRLEATGLYRLTTRLEADGVDDAGGQFRMWALGARGCGVPSVRTVEFPLCAGIEGGRIIAEGFGLPDVRTARVPWGAATLVPTVAWSPRRPFAIVAAAVIGFPFNRADLVIEGLGTLHRVPAVFGRGFIGVEGRFP